MRVGVLTPLLSPFPLDVVLKKVSDLNIKTVELATGNYVGDAHCKLAMLENECALRDFKKLLGDHGISISALSCHGNALHRTQPVLSIEHEDSLLFPAEGVTKAAQLLNSIAIREQPAAAWWT